MLKQFVVGVDIINCITGETMEHFSVIIDRTSTGYLEAIKDANFRLKKSGNRSTGYNGLRVRPESH